MAMTIREKFAGPRF